MPNHRRPMNIGLLFDWHAERSRQTVMHLDRPFDTAPAGETTYDGAALAAAVVEISAWLHAAGVRKGDRVAIAKDNHYDVFLVAAAAARLGALPAMIAPLNALDAVQAMIRRLAPKVLVAGYGLLARAAAAGCVLADDAVRVVAVGAGGGELPPGALTIDALRGSEAPAPQPVADDEPMIVTHSSGTTGVPKLVVHSAHTILGAMSRLESVRWPVVESKLDDVVASSVPFAHARSVSWTAGQLALTPKSLVAISDHGIESVAKVMAEHRPTTLEACPNIFQRWEELVDREPELFAQVRLFVGTFDAVHPRTVRKFLAASKRRIPVWGQSWGQSEVGPVCVATFTRRHVRPRTDAHSATSDIGWPVPILSKVRVVDSETGRRQRRGRPGLMMVATKARCLTYLGEDDRHREKCDGKWFNTGDVGARGWFGKLRLVDREVDLIPGMSAIELESVLLDRLERATEVTVLGVPGSPPVPVLCMRDDRLDPDEWQRATADLPELGEPRVVPWDEVPRTATWKVRRTDLKEKVLGTKEAIGSGRWT